MQTVLNRIADGSLTANCKGLVSDKEDRGCIQIAKDAGLPYIIVKKEKNENQEEYDIRLNDAIRSFSNDDNTYIACLGWMFLLSPWFIDKWRNKIVNVHPALLPKFPGAHAISDALNAGATKTGMTIHYIDEGVDTGPIIKQASCPILDDDTEESLKERIQELEKKEYPKVLQEIEEGKPSL